MGWFVKAPSLHPGEDIIFDRFANRQVGRRAIGGRLVATPKRLIFTPNAVDMRTGGKQWSLNLSEVSEVIVERRSDPYWGRFARIRPRLFIKTDGGEEAFLVNRAHHVGAQLVELMAQRSA
jgi:hypothetical protein